MRRGWSVFYSPRGWICGLGLVCLCMIVSSAEFPATAGAAPPTPGTFPNPLGYVSDYAGVLDEAWRARIRSVCRDLEKKTGVELVVVTTRDIAPYTGVRQYADALYKHWRIGTVQQDHGVLLLAYLERPQASVTLGRSMIRVISPTLLRQITRRFVNPAFQAGQYGEGLYRTVVALSSASQDIRVGQPGRRHTKAVAVFVAVLTVVGVLGFLWWVSRPDKRHPFRRIQRGEFWASGQGGFGGNFGGFGGATSGEGYD